MAKARKPPPSAAERLLGTYRASGPAAAPGDLADLAEADVWYSREGPTTKAGAFPAGAVPPSANGRHMGGLSRAFADGRHLSASAPVEVPAWPSHFAEPDPPQEREEDDDDAGGWVPPHVYLARRQARASVVEGAGRTLKGRDASRVRDAVWSRTGFDG